MRFFRRSHPDTTPPPAMGYTPEHHALERLNILSTSPGPDEALHANGRFVVVAGRVMFVVGADVNHTNAIERSGLPASPDTVVGYYEAARAHPGAPWRFTSIGHRLLRGSRVGPDQGSGAVAQAAFAASGYGDVSAVLRR